MIINKTTFVGPRSKSVFGFEKLGGGTVLFENLINRLGPYDVLINSNGASKLRSLNVLFNLWLIIRFLFISSKNHVIVMAAHRQAICFIAVNLIRRRDITIRLIGANFSYWYNDMLSKSILGLCSKHTRILCELECDMEFFRSFKIETLIQENFRDIEISPTPRKLLNETVGFIGRVCNEKGVEDFIALANSNPNKPFVIAGPFANKNMEKLVLDSCVKLENLSYIGVLNHTDQSKFWDHIGMLFFHSEHKGEGKPGVIVEALLRKVVVLTNYKVHSPNWKIFYDCNAIQLTDDYQKTLTSGLRKPTWNDEALEIFSADYCYQEMKGYA